MRKYDVVKRHRSGTIVVSVQSNHLSDLDTRLVLPLVPAGSRNLPIKRLNPVVELGGKRYYIATENAAALKMTEFGPNVGSLADYGDEIQGALDFLTVGF